MKTSLSLTLLFGVLMVFYLGIERASAQWVSAGPNGGYVRNLINCKDTLYATAGDGNWDNLYTSRDNGNTWIPISSPTWPNQSDGGKCAIAKFGNRFFAGTYHGIFRSDDNGMTWVNKSNASYPGMCFAMQGSSLFVGTFGGILRSEDNGESWTMINPGVDFGNIISLLTTGSEIYAGADGQEGVFHSSDNGNTWEKYYGEGIAAVSGYSLAFIGGDLFVGTDYYGIWKLTTSTNTWAQAYLDVNCSFFRAITGTQSAIFATTLCGTLRSTDGGANWTDISGNGILVHYSENGSKAVMTGSTVLVGTPGGIYRSEDYGNTFTESDNGLHAQGITSPAVVSSGSFIYTAATYGGVFRSSDQGQSWVDVSNGLDINYREPGQYFNDRMVGADSTTVYAGKYKSTNSGTSWELHNSPGKIHNNPAYFSNMPWIEKEGVLLTVEEYTGVFRSVDNGATWTLSNTGLPAQGTYQDIFPEGRNVILGMVPQNGEPVGVYYSGDNGATWQQSIFNGTPYAPNMALTKFYSNGTTCFFGTINPGLYAGEGVYRSTDNGESWTRVLANVAGYSMAVTGDTVYVATLDVDSHYQVYRSVNDGQNWTPVLNTAVLMMATLAAKGPVVFIAQSTATENKILCSTNAGTSWQDITPDGEYTMPRVTNFTILNDKVYAGTIGGSMFTRNMSDFYAPAMPGPITGNPSPCQTSSQIYSIPNVPGVTYTWQIPSNWTITAGSGTNSITVTVGSFPGIVLVTPTNAFGSGPSQFMIVNPTTLAPMQPGAIAGSTAPLEGTILNYNVVNDPGVSYAWTFPTGWIQTAGGTTNSVTVIVGAGSGNISVTPSTPCGTGTSRTLAVETSPANISVSNITIVNGQDQCYNASGTIIVAGGANTFLVQNGGQATFIAGQMISFLPGTKVETGGYLLGTITTTGQYCGALPAAKSVAMAAEGLAP
ncbi:MAG: hypothetical protein NT040_03705, partial [Bacteroidetes bacterium]|nr:hypothetical protein [Bacteroidota bacterium]